MYFNDFHGEKLPGLGFGAMRLPTLENGQVDEALVEKMVALAMENGVNYFDTAVPYHEGTSELVMGRVLGKYPRDSYFLADKFPGHQILPSYDPAAIFEEQLKKCGVEYFDYYLLHNVNENSLKTYLDPRWGILDYFKEQKRLGRIRHLGFSTHGRLDMMREFLSLCGSDMEFCQIQLNYLDWTLQFAKEKYELLTQAGIAVWVMEPVRGGSLAKLSPENEAKLKAVQPGASAASWGFRFLQDLPNVKMILSGMSNLAQMEDNLRTFAARNPLSGPEKALVLEIAESMKDTVPCTACRYCCDGCPMGLNIPALIGVCNELRVNPTSVNTGMFVEFLPEDKKPSACIACGKCVKICPQGINIPEVMQELTRRMKNVPSWAEISKKRAEEQARLREKMEEKA